MEKAVDSLNIIIDETQASIVLTTSHKTRFTLDNWKELLKSRGINVSNVKMTKDQGIGISRKDEIIDWFNENNREDFVVIDDDKSLYDLPEKIRSKCVITKPL